MAPLPAKELIRTKWFLALLLSSAASAKTTSTHTPIFGSVTGHVICADTNGPRRLAKNLLAPLPNPKSHRSTDHTTALPGIATDLNGAFRIDRVPPREYPVATSSISTLIGVPDGETRPRNPLPARVLSPFLFN